MFSAPRLSFVICHPPFDVQCSIFVICHSLFVVCHLSFPHAISLQYPPATLRAVAHSGGGGFRVVFGHGPFCICFPIVGGDVAVSTRNPPCKQWLAGLGQVLGRLSSSTLHAPHFHPASSCSWRWLGWLWWLSSSLMCFIS
jgi:hypothetical protein